MSTPKLSRSFDLDVRVAGDGRTLVGVAVPYGQVTDLGGGQLETFDAGAFARSIAERGDRVKVLANHDNRSWPIGKPSVLYETEAGLMIEARISATAEGDEALTLV